MISLYNLLNEDMKNHEKQLILMKKYICDKQLDVIVLPNTPVRVQGKYMDIKCNIKYIEPVTELGLAFEVGVDLTARREDGFDLANYDYTNIFEYLYADKLKYFLRRSIGIDFGKQQRIMYYHRNTNKFSFEAPDYWES